MKYHASVAIGYKALFDDYDSVDPKELIKDISTINSLEIIGYFIAQLHTRERSFEVQIEFVRIWSSRFPKQIIPKIEDFIKNTTGNFSSFNFINNIASLILIEVVLENHNNIPPVKDLSPEQELNLFKAYLWCNQHWTDKQSGKLPKVKTVDDLNSIIFPIQLPYMEILEFKDFRIQCLKAIFFFRFCVENEIFKNYVKAFLDDYEIESWQEYLINILSLYTRKFEKLKTPSILNIQDEHKTIKDFLNQFCLNNDDFVKTDDFKSIRKTPVYKIDENKFLFLNLNFFVDKLFQGIQFELFRVLKKNKLTYKNKPIEDFDQFRSIYAEQISEKGIFYSTIKYAFEKSGYKLLDGQQLKFILKGSEPDFYIRDKGKIYLFEYKDVILNADIKHSYDYEQIKTEIAKKMISNEEGRQKGINQLFKSIVSIRTGGYSEVDNYKNLTDCIICPIIVFTDFSFNLPGVNYYLNQEFQKLVEASDLSQKHKIKDLTLIDIDTFLKFQDLFRDKKLKINNCLNDFRSKTRKTDNFFSMIESFNIFIHKKTDKMDYGTPKLLIDEITEMI